jgi:hypothetical protein
VPLLTLVAASKKLNLKIMNQRILTMTILFLFLNGFGIAQTEVKSVRLKLIDQFIQAFNQDTLSNSDIMKKYVVDGDYFKKDSIKGLADLYLNEARRCIKLTSRHNIGAYQYLDRENKHSVTDRPIGQPERLQKLKFSLNEKITSAKPKEKKFDIIDLYIVEFDHIGGYDFEQDNLFILFNEYNKIVSFAGFRSNNYVELYQF